MSDPKQQPVQYYDLKAAREHGISDADILKQLAQTHNYDLAGAREHGISDEEILNTLVTAKPPAEPVVEKESPEMMGGIGATTGAVAAAGDIIYSKGRPLIRMAEKAMGREPSAPVAKPRTFLDPSTVAQQAIERRTVAAPDITGSPEAVKNWGVSQHEGEFLGGKEYSQADKIKKEAMAFEAANPTKKVLPGSLLAVPQEEADRLAKQRAELAAQEDVAKQAEVRQVAQKRAERLGERSALKQKQTKFDVTKGTAGLLGKAAMPIVGGYEAGSQGAQAYNRLTRPDLTAGDVASGAANVVGAGAGALSMVPSKYRIPAAIIAQGAGAVANWLDKRNPRDEPVVEQKAAGGLTGYAGGKTVEKVAKKLSSGLDLGKILPSATFKSAPEQTVTDPLRNAFPGIYKRPDVIAQEAAARVAPESPALKQLFGVTRDDLYQMGKGRVGNVPGLLPGAAANPKGSRAAVNVMNPRNEQRLLDVLSESEKHPELVRGMDPWYIMDPAYKRLEELVGPEEAVKRYKQLNTLTGMASPGSDVLTEMNRGTAANYLATQGRFSDFVDYAGKPMGARGADFPDDLRAVMGHPYHRTAQAIPMQQYLDTGAVQMSSPKVPAYIQASSVPQAGFQTDLPVGDAHWSRAVGLADTRGAATRKGQSVVPGASVSNPEMSTLAPWWKDKIAGQVGLESVPAQARAWGAFSPQTGVESPIGAPKLELLSMKIMEAANRYGVSPEQARDMILKGEGYAGKAAGGSIDGYSDGKSVMPDVSVNARSMPNMTGMPGVGYMQTPQGAMARLQMEKELEEARIRAGVSGMAMSIPGQQGIKTMPGQMDIGANIPVGRGNLDISANRSINPIPGRGHMQGVNARYTMPFAEGGGVPHFASGKKVILEEIAKKIIKPASKIILPPAENAARTQIIGTLPTYAKAADVLAQRGAGGTGIDVGAGLGKGAEVLASRLGKDVRTMEPYAQKWSPDYSSAEQMPSDAHGFLTNLNVLNVMPREARDELVQHIGRTMEPGGLGVLTTRGADVMKAQGRPGPEPMSMITSRDTYQKGFTNQELEDYLKYMLGQGYDINKLNLGPAGALIQKKGIGGSIIKGALSLFKGKADDVASKYHPLVQKGLAEGRIHPNDAQWMSDYAHTPGRAEVETGTGAFKDQSERMQNFVARMERGEVPIPSHMQGPGGVNRGANSSGLNPPVDQ